MNNPITELTKRLMGCSSVSPLIAVLAEWIGVELRHERVSDVDAILKIAEHILQERAKSASEREHYRLRPRGEITIEDCEGIDLRIVEAECGRRGVPGAKYPPDLTTDAERVYWHVLRQVNPFGGIDAWAWRDYFYDGKWPNERSHSPTVTALPPS